MTDVIEPQPWGSPPPNPWSTRRTVATVGVAGLLALGGAAVIHAAGGSQSPAAATPPGHSSSPSSGKSNEPNLPTAVHGQFVVSDGHGGFSTQLTQTGRVLTVSDTALTARSDDGFTQTYVINTDTRIGRDGVRVGDTATIRAVTADGIATAKAISPQR